MLPSPASPVTANGRRLNWFIVVLLFAFGIMTFLNIEQERVIAAQRDVIRYLSHDSLAFLVARIKGRAGHHN